MWRSVGRALTTAALPPHKLMPMPRLSPTMTTGTLLKWRVAEGAALPESGMDPACDVLPSGLTDDPEDEDVVLEIESHEEGFLARILLAEGATAAPDEAIAVICDSEADIERLREVYDTDVARERPLVEAGTFAWQAYLAAGEVGRSCSNS